ncbi:MAG TPA: 16S rRNA (cytosine(967)-C(5))-methyltransferase RsmB [Solirubrobacteraceae bacterium]|jgi:16S rRNA (cytosine967-C5)-methyltransferase|nr:16S rRNA (cytosine(967)-C(5))-methyltransferase RsmB [Solirubrobacteraceae bacterium]
MGVMTGTPTTAIAPARRCAFAVLRRVFEHGAYADLALQSEAAGLDRRDRALAMRLAYGAVQRKGTLDHLIGELAERPPQRLDPPVLAALRLGLYELLYLSGSPDRAVVADAVELAKTQGRGGHGLVNAVLRRAGREGADALLGALGDTTPERAAVKHSHPEWIARLWWERLGADGARALMAYDNEPGEVALRANTLVTDAATLASDLHATAVPTHLDPGLPEAVVLDGPLDVHDSPLWKAGAFHAQSRAAMHVARVLDPRSGERVLDLCAAPGGKTTHLAALMDGGGEVLAVERNRRRAGELTRTAARLHAGNVRVEVGDAAADRGDRSFDRVLVDPPCSGLGTLQARADLRWRVTPAAINEMAQSQAAILAAGASALRPGGVLVYSTCTISSSENEHVVTTFLDSHADFSLDDLAPELPDFASGPPGTDRRDGTGMAGTVLTLPHRDRTAGFFIARLRRS